MEKNNVVDFKDVLDEMLGYTIDDELLTDEVQKIVKSGSGNKTIGKAVSAAMVLQSLRGNVQAFTTIRDTVGQKPVDKVEQDTTIRVLMSDEAKELGN